MPRPYCSTPFPYTTLFQSDEPGCKSGVPLLTSDPGGHVVLFRLPPGTYPFKGRYRGVVRRRRGDDDGEFGVQAAVQRRRSEEHTSELQSLRHLVCRLLLEK